MANFENFLSNFPYPASYLASAHKDSSKGASANKKKLSPMESPTAFNSILFYVMKCERLMFFRLLHKIWTIFGPTSSKESKFGPKKKILTTVAAVACLCDPPKFPHWAVLHFQSRLRLKKYQFPSERMSISNQYVKLKSRIVQNSPWESMRVHESPWESMVAVLEESRL